MRANVHGFVYTIKILMDALVGQNVPSPAHEFPWLVNFVDNFHSGFCFCLAVYLFAFSLFYGMGRIYFIADIIRDCD